MWSQVTRKELQRAVAELDAAEANGFPHSTAVFEPGGTERALVGPGVKIYLRFSGLIVKAHPTDKSKNWGFANPDCFPLYREQKFVNGELLDAEE